MNSNNYNNRLHISISRNQFFVYKKLISDLGSEWKSVPKRKQKFYYKLYWKLLKRQIVQCKKLKNKNKLFWTYSLSTFDYRLHKMLCGEPLHVKNFEFINRSSFYKNINISTNYKRFYIAKLKGKTGNAEKVLDFKSLNTQYNVLLNYYKLKTHIES